jgi:hypothetical protein
VTCDEFIQQTIQVLRDRHGVPHPDAVAMVDDKALMDEMHGDLLSPEDAAADLIAAIMQPGAERG